MPIYEYRCTACGHQFEVLARMSDDPPAACESCGEAVLEKVLHPAHINYRGSGFYSTDYGRGSGGSSSAGSSAGEGSTGGSSSSGSGSAGGSGSGSAGGSGSSGSGS